MARALSYKSIVLRGLLSGVLFGGTYGLVLDNAWLGAATGTFFGVTMAVVMRRQWGGTALASLNRQERKAVGRALRRGQPVDDPRLATALQEQADAVLAMRYPVTAMRVGGWVFALFGAVVCVFGIVSGTWSTIGSGSLLLVLAALYVFVGVPFGLRQRERVARSAEATRARLAD